MARKLRIDMAGYHHVINRGVEKRRVFMDEDDYAMFLHLLCEMCTRFEMKLHSYCLMSNHYHLLLESKNDNLSEAMRFLNSRYAVYFNTRLKRVGHLWQGRYKSWYVSDEVYLYSLIKYIEFNALKAKMVKSLDQYKHSSYRAFVGRDEAIACLKESLLFTQYACVEERVEFFKSAYDKDEIRMIAKSSRLVAAPMNKKALSPGLLETMFKEAEDKAQRNEKIKEAIALGYSQHQIAKAAKLTQAMVSLVLKGQK